METKKCNNYYETKPLSEYYERKKGSGKYMNCCKECNKRNRREWGVRVGYKQNPAKKIASQKKYRDRHRDRLNQERREWAGANKEMLKDRSQKHYRENKVKINERTSVYKKAHPEKHNMLDKEYYKRNKEVLRERRIKNRDDIRRKGREYVRKNKDRCRASAKQWSDNNPEKRRAHDKVSKAVRKGVLVPPSECEKCGEDRLQIDAHHEDYSRPLDVKWLCRSCHKEIHIKAKSDKRG